MKVYNDQMMRAARSTSLAGDAFHGLINPIKSIYALTRGGLDWAGGFGKEEHEAGAARNALRAQKQRRETRKESSAAFTGGAMKFDFGAGGSEDAKKLINKALKDQGISGG